ncbi:MAG: elongation factor 4 [Chloroflexi bacterium]|nr:MAG: elongation factor 4 [Chloroflexota bacterium]
MEQSRIRNFCIIAHIDHGKSTLADRLLEITGTIPPRQMAEQVLDQMDLERERGITIKATAVRMDYRSPDSKLKFGDPGPKTVQSPESRVHHSGSAYELNLIDTPGHVDFTYEVSRALAACEGALLVVDASQGIEAQTLANVYMALGQETGAANGKGLTIIPVVNKIDLPSAEPERVAQELVDVIGFSRDEVLFVSAKEGTGCEELLEAIVERVPPPSGDAGAPLRALIFDSKYDSYKGVIAYVGVVDGRLTSRDKVRLMANRKTVEPLEIGVFRPSFAPTDELSTGEVGYVATGLKTVRECRVGDTITDNARPAAVPLPGYKPAKPMVFAGLYPANAEDYEELRDALEKLQLNDASLQYQPEQSAALGPGFRAGFLGLLHMDIVQERLEREYGLDLLATAPSVEYRVLLTDGGEIAVDSPAELPEPTRIAEVREPWMNISVVAPDRYYGPVMELVTARRGVFVRMEYLDHAPAASASVRPEALEGRRVLLEFKMPLAEMLVDFYDQLKSRTQGYASMDYAVSHYAGERLVKLDVLVNGVPVDALSVLIDADKATPQGRAIVEKLRSLIPRQLFEVPIQAAVGGRIVARETVRALRKNVLAKCYGGDVTRKRKLLEKQKEGKRRMKRVGNVDIPQEAFMSLLRIGK